MDNKNKNFRKVETITSIGLNLFLLADLFASSGIFTYGGAKCVS